MKCQIAQASISFHTLHCLKSCEIEPINQSLYFFAAKTSGAGNLWLLWAAGSLMHARGDWVINSHDRMRGLEAPGQTVRFTSRWRISLIAECGSCAHEIAPARWDMRKEPIDHRTQNCRASENMDSSRDSGGQVTLLGAQEVRPLPHAHAEVALHSSSALSAHTSFKVSAARSSLPFRCVNTV